MSNEIGDFRNIYWAEDNLPADYYGYLTNYLQYYPAYDWPAAVRYTAFPDIYGYIETDKLLELWGEVPPAK